MNRTLETAEDIQNAIAAHISALPPEQQQEIVAVVVYTFRAGYAAAQRDIQTANASLLEQVLKMRREHGI